MIHRVACLVACLVVGLSYVSARADYVTTIRPEALFYENYGKWFHLQWCSVGTYAYAFDARMMPYAGPGWADDTALNGVMLKCRSPRCPYRDSSGIPTASANDITSHQSEFGTYTGRDISCPNGYALTGAQLHSTPNQGWWKGEGLDDTGGNMINFRCLYWLEYGKDNTALQNSVWIPPKGKWSQWIDCPKGTAICGIRTFIETPPWWLDHIYGYDHTGINGVEFTCCRLPSNCF